MILPKSKKEIELKKIDTNTILSVFDEQSVGKIYPAMLSMVVGSIDSLNGEKPSINELKLLPLVDIEYIILESFKKFGLPTKLEGVYPCPRLGCGNKIIHELKDGNDNRFDLNDAPVLFCDNEDEVYKVETPNHIISKPTQEIEIQSMSFRDITLDDLIQISSKQGNIRSRLNEIFNKTLVDIEYASEPYLTFEQIKNRYRLDIFNFPEYSINEQIIMSYRKYGIQLFQKHQCDSCGKEWEAPVDFTSFFVYALNSMSQGMSRG